MAAVMYILMSVCRTFGCYVLLFPFFPFYWPNESTALSFLYPLKSVLGELLLFFDAFGKTATLQKFIDASSNFHHSN